LLATFEVEDELKAPKVVSREEWLVARRALLAKEKEATRQRDALNAARRALPMLRVEKDYVFTGAGENVTLGDLFQDHGQLLIYHFMFDPAWDEGCKSCSHLVDCVDGAVVHLKARDTAFVAVSLAPFTKIDAFKRRMGWKIPWVSSAGSDFNRDFAVSIDIEGGLGEYNYTSARDLLAAGKIWSPKMELPGLSAFLRHDGDIYHTYSAYQRGLDILLNTYNLLDLGALGRGEDDIPIQSWIRHHDRYGA
jgi:predicted dithiol-disulfide oxidoreductase (DUF899 family)